MQKRQEIQQKSRLGLLLINKGLITSSQLDEALQLQNRTGMRLGEVLINKGWITERQLNRSLKKQTRYRYVAALVAILLGPIQPFMASASVEREPISTEQIVEQKEHIYPAEFSGLTSLTDSDMGNVTAQGVNENLARLQDIMAGTQGNNSNQNTLETIGSLLLPATDLLDADVEMTGVTYGKGQNTSLNEDGSIQLALPTHIEEIAFKNIRVKGSENQHMGDLFIRGIDLSNVNVSIKVHN
jgi:hypothetical protein|tara:strand:+ start:4202 stop:4927 length:726 start_codon:yes stop_codon:yes gene_type:complete